MTQSNSMIVDAQQHVARHVTFLASLFAIFSFGILLPLLYGVGAPFYASAQIELPAVTSWFVNMSPWILIGTAFAICAVLTTVRIKGGFRTSQVFNWLSIFLIAAITLVGALAFLLPLIAIMSGLRG